ncbi:MAG: PEP-CTERM sorting domain-containing protein [Planctomycetales bacterium]|nr:PEP-CTERM sorting domain-containing protein [Planctomycetales bacterium]
MKVGKLWAVFAVMSAMLSGVNAQVLEFDFDDQSAWTVVQDADASADFGFDYSVYGIPAAPGGTGTTGLRLASNLVDPEEAQAIAVSPTGIELSGEYTVEVDVWLNFYADPGKYGTTEFGALWVGVDPNGSPINGAGLVADGDGDSGSDYRMYFNEAFLPIESELYAVPSLNHVDPVFLEAFLGEIVPEEQLDFDVWDTPNEDILSPAGTLAFAWHKFVADVDTNSGFATFYINDIEIGTVLAEPGELEGGVAVGYWDIFGSVAPVSDFAFGIFDNLKISLSAQSGDFDNDGDLDADDIDTLTAAIANNDPGSVFDVNGDGDLDASDRSYWITELKNTWFGDSNLDGEFSSADFVAVFTNGEYEDGIADNSGWADGDWNGDGEFDSSDFVAAFTDGGFEVGPRGAVSAVPEPNSLVMILLGVGSILAIRRCKS